MAYLLMSIGTNVFLQPVLNHDSPNFDTIKRDTNISWVGAQRLGRDVAFQYTGDGEDTIIVEGRLYPRFFGGLSTLRSIRASAAKPQPMLRFYPFRAGADFLFNDIAELDLRGAAEGWTGEFLGNFVITRVNDTESKIGSANIAHKVDFTIELKRYGDDPGEAQPGWSGNL